MANYLKGLVDKVKKKKAGGGATGQPIAGRGEPERQKIKEELKEKLATVSGKPQPAEEKVVPEKKAIEEPLPKKPVVKEEVIEKTPEKEAVDAAKGPEEENKDPEGKSKTEKEMDRVKKKEIESYGKTKIFSVSGQAILYYYTPVPRPTGAEKGIINTIKEAATRIISIAPYKIRDLEQRRHVYYEKVMEILRASPELNIPKARYEFYASAVVSEMVGYGIIDPLIKDDKLEEIMVIGPRQPVYVFHRKYEMMKTNIEFYSDSEIEDLINRIARQIGRRVDRSAPLLDARLPDGSRVNATIAPASVSGATLTIRKFKADPYSIVDLLKMGTLTPEAAAFLWLCVEGLGVKPANILIAGGTGSGKTTTLNILSSFVPTHERIITIEDTAELNLPLQHWIRLEAKPPGLEGVGELTLDILTKNSLRMRPDRIIVGEVRHAEAFALFTAMNTGHDGCLGTVHSNSPGETIARIKSPPMNVPEIMLSGLNFVIIEHRIHDKKKGTIRRVTEIAEISGVLEGKTRAQTIFKWDPATDKLVRTKAPVKYFGELESLAALSGKELDAELKGREKVLKGLMDKGTRGMKEVSKACLGYLLEKEG